MRIKKITALFLATAVLLGITLSVTSSAIGPIILPNDKYYVKNVNSQKVLAVMTNPDGTSSLTAGITQWDFNGYAGQQWSLTRANNGAYSFTPMSNTASRLHLTDRLDANGATVQTFPAVLPSFQQWWIYQNSNGTYRLVPIVSYTRTLNVRGSVLDNGAGIEIWNEIGSPSQQWRLIPVKAVCSQGGLANRNVTIQLLDTNTVKLSIDPTWRSVINDAVTSWNICGAGVNITTTTSGPNQHTIRVDAYSDVSWNGIIYKDPPGMVATTSSRIYINTTGPGNFGATSGDSTTQANRNRRRRWTVAHELGHLFWLADNPTDKEHSVMRYDDYYDNSLPFTPRIYDVNFVKNFYS